MYKVSARIFAFVVLLSLLSYLGGCAPSGLYVVGGGGPLEPDRIVDVHTGTLLTEEQLIERLARERIIFIGEYHDHIVQHQNQLKIIQGIFDRYPDLVVGLELFSRQEQGVLDKWVDGSMDQAEFMSTVGGKILGGDIFEAYYPLLEWARANKVKLLALNAPRSITAKVAKGGMDVISDEDKKYVARETVFGPEAYKQRIVQAFEDHAGFMNLDYFFAAQVVWDETMAETLADYLSSPEGQAQKAVVIAGNEHIYQRYGIPDRTARRLSEPQTVVFTPVAAEDMKIGPGDADYVWVTAMQPPKKRLRLGIRIANPEDKKLVVEEVTPGSEAERIGLKKGDVLLSLDGKPLSSMMEFHRVAVEGGAEAEHKIEVEREGMRVGFSFKFRETEE